MQTTRTRLARPDEARVIADIEASAARKFRGLPGFETVDFSFLPRPEAFEPFVAAGRAFVVVDARDRPLGFVSLDFMDGEPYIAELDVALDYQGNGLGRILIERACAWAREQGAGSILLSTNRTVPWNAPYYARLGFSDVPHSDYHRPDISAQREREAQWNDMTTRVFMRKRLA